MAKYGRKTLRLDTSGIEELLKRVDEFGGSVEKTAELVLKKAAVAVQNDTVLALSDKDLPAKGKYSTGRTLKSVIHFSKPEWNGTVVSVPVGFDFEKPGAGGFLISGRRAINGTPRVKPDMKLREIYKGKRYMDALQKKMWADAQEELEKLWR